MQSQSKALDIVAVPCWNPVETLENPLLVLHGNADAAVLYGHLPRPVAWTEGQADRDVRGI